MKRFLSYCVTACLAAVLALIGDAGQLLHAQQTLQDGVIFGTVTDASGAVLPDTKVEVTSPALQGSRSTNTDAAGAYRLSNLPGGIYHITYEKAGFQTDVHDNFTLSAGFNARVDVALKAGATSQTVVVTGQAPVIDTSTTVTSTTLERQTLDAVPTTRAMTDAVYLTPGVRPSNTPDIGGSVLGLQQAVATFGFGGNVVTLEDGMNGMQQNSEHGGPQGGGPGQLVDYDSLAELRVIPTAADADIGPAGPVMITTMKAGGNEFHGDAHFFMEPKWFQATDLPSTAPGGKAANQLQYFYDAFADIGGRAIRDRLWFYTAYHLQRNSLAVYGYTGPNGGQGFNPTHQDNNESKVTWQATKNIKVIGDYLFASKFNPQYMGSSSVPYGSTYYYYVPFWDSKGEMTWTPNAKWLIDAIGGKNWQLYSYPNQAGVNVPGNPFTVNQTTGVTTGAQNALTQFDGGSHDRLQFGGSVTYYPSGKHSYQVGTQMYLPQHDNGYFLNHPSGNYEVFTQGLGTAASPLVPYELSTFNFPFIARGYEHALGFYAKDTWRVTNRLTLNYGGRFDAYRVFHNAQTAPQGQFSAGGSFPGATVFQAKRVIPRVGVAYDLTGNGKTVVRASYGMYNIDPTGEFDLTEFNPTSLTTTTYNWAGDTCQVTQYSQCTPSAAFLSSLQGANSTFKGQNIYITTSSPALAIINTKLRMPFFHTISAGVERALGSSMALRVLYVGNYEEDMYDEIYPNRPLSSFTVPYTTPYPITDPINSGKLVTILQYPTSLKSANQTEFVNRSGNEDYYNSGEITLTKRKVGKWSAYGSVDFTKDHRYLTTTNIFPSTNNYGESSAQPTAPYKAAFPLDLTWDYTFKSYFTYDLPYRVQFGVNYELLAGQPNYAMDQVSTPTLGLVTFPVNQFGSFRNPIMHILNLRFGRVFPIKEHSTLEATVELFNALNVAPGETINTINGAPNTTKQFGYVSAYLPPLVGKFGVEYKF